jgi:GNAT superfamily N-acetyltransferase
MRYRTATVDDARALAEMRWEFRAMDAPEPVAESRAAFLPLCSAFIERGIESGDWTVWVAEDEGNLVAHIFVLTIAKVPKPDRLHNTMAFVTNVYARPAYRNRGIGSELMRHVVAWAHTLEFEMLFVWPGEESLPFYERAGFIPENEPFRKLEVRP